MLWFGLAFAGTALVLALVALIVSLAVDRPERAGADVVDEASGVQGGGAE